MAMQATAVTCNARYFFDESLGCWYFSEEGQLYSGIFVPSRPDLSQLQFRVGRKYLLQLQSRKDSSIICFHSLPELVANDGFLFGSNWIHWTLHCAVMLMHALVT